MEFSHPAERVAANTFEGALPGGDELREALEQLRDDGNTVVVLLELGAARGGGAADYAWMRRFALPVICSFEGRLDGGAAGLALCSDIRICGQDAMFFLGGLDAAGQALLTALASGRKARLVEGEPALSADRLLELGLVSEVAAAGKAGDAAKRLAAVMASRGPIALELGKEAIWRGLGMRFEQALRFETDLTLLLQTTKDRAEGVAAFMEKRTPRFTGT
jgi:enoyl-CoA hydratase/carnithine racemase